MQKKGFNLIGFIILIAIVPLIAWGLNAIIKMDFADSAIKTVAVHDNSTVQDIETPSTIPDTTIVATTTTIALATTTTTVKKPQPVVATKIATTTVPTPVPTSAAEPAQDSTNTVTLTDSGFSPAKITISRGDAVTFVNDSSGKMWIAANPFPSSSEYPAFNEKVGVSNGDSWTFTFDQAGTWFYHNHFSPATGAKVVVSWK